MVNGHILIRGLRVATRVGVTSEERARPQTVVLDVDLDADLSRAAASDELVDTVDYSAAVTRIADVVSTSEAKLLEHLAGKVVSVLSRMDGVRGVTVQIAKEPPPVAEDLESVAVRIVRSET
jgi:dihydroneopterin aldolase